MSEAFEKWRKSKGISEGGPQHAWSQLGWQAAMQARLSSPSCAKATEGRESVGGQEKLPGCGHPISCYVKSPKGQFDSSMGCGWCADKAKLEAEFAAFKDKHKTTMTSAEMEAYFGKLSELQDGNEKLEARCAEMEIRRASEIDLLNTELRENYGSARQVQSISEDLRPAILALVDGAKQPLLDGLEKAEADLEKAKLTIAELDFGAGGVLSTLAWVKAERDALRAAIEREINTTIDDNSVRRLEVALKGDK